MDNLRGVKTSHSFVKSWVAGVAALILWTGPGAVAAINLPPSGAGADADGGAAQDVRIYKTGSACGTIAIDYDHFSVPDRFVVYQGREQIFDSGLVSDAGYEEIQLTGTSDQIKVVYNPGNNQDAGTEWNYKITYALDGSDAYQNWLAQVTQFESDVDDILEQIKMLKQQGRDALAIYKRCRNAKLPPLHLQINPVDHKEGRLIDNNQQAWIDWQENTSTLYDALGLVDATLEVIVAFDSIGTGTLLKKGLNLAAAYAELPTSFSDLVALAFQKYDAYHTDPDNPYVSVAEARAQLREYNRSKAEIVRTALRARAEVIRISNLITSLRADARARANELARQIRNDPDLTNECNQRAQLLFSLGAVLLFKL